MTKARDLVDLDPRIAATGGRRRNPRDPKSNYEWPGMTALPDWRATRVHRHTVAYGCAKCGATFGTPHAVYAHLARVHSAAGSRPVGGRSGLSGTSTRGNGRIEDSPSQIASERRVPRRDERLAFGFGEVVPA